MYVYLFIRERTQSEIDITKVTNINNKKKEVPNSQ